MPRLKGSKNRVAEPQEQQSLTEQIHVTEAAIAAAETELEELLATIDSQKKEYQAKKKAQKQLSARLDELRVKQADEEAKAAAEAKRAEAARLIDKLLSSGKTAEEILALIGRTEQTREFCTVP